MNRYDEVPYSCHPFPQSHPDRLALVGKLFGVPTKPIDNCRVLELGCGRGGNLLPMAEQLPGSEFIGVELSEVQANEAQMLARKAELTNADIRHANILDVDDSFGQFDYIIVHGVYSWVPKAVQKKILDICSQNLAEFGVAYVSYNVYPGWNMRGMLRDMMCYHASRFDTPQQRIQQARCVLDFVASNTSDKTPYGMFLQSEVNLLRNQGDEYLYHEHLSDVNDPVYFFEFAKRCSEAGLQYLGESDVAGMFLGHFSNEIVSTVERVASDFIQMEQYLDFLRNRMFRQSLLTHVGVPIDRQLKSKSLHGLYLSTDLQLEKEEPLDSESPMAFVKSGVDAKAMVSHPFIKAAMWLLAKAAPSYIAYDQLLVEVRKLVDTRAMVSREQFDSENTEFGRTMLKFFVNRMVNLHSCAPAFQTSSEACTVASRLARVQSENGSLVTTLSHENARVSDFEARILRYLDGNNDRDSVCKLIAEFFHANFVENGDIDKEGRVRKAVDDALSRFAQIGLLSLQNESVAK